MGHISLTTGKSESSSINVHRDKWRSIPFCRGRWVPTVCHVRTPTTLGRVSDSYMQFLNVNDTLHWLHLLFTLVSSKESFKVYFPEGVLDGLCVSMTVPVVICPQTLSDGSSRIPQFYWFSSHPRMYPTILSFSCNSFLIDLFVTWN